MITSPGVAPVVWMHQALYCISVFWTRVTVLRLALNVGRHMHGMQGGIVTSTLFRQLVWGLEYIQSAHKPFGPNRYSHNFLSLFTPFFRVTSKKLFCNGAYEQVFGHTKKIKVTICYQKLILQMLQINLEQWTILSPRIYFTISREFFSCHNWRRREFLWHLIGESQGFW